MDKNNNKPVPTDTAGTEATEMVVRRAFVAKLAKAAIVPAVVAGIAASALRSSAQAYPT